ncbi:flippase [Reinekea thalattae]|uniref:Flippase n=1 Tax=Reinekea thalattae TaxID=2593301 RepID=A0A5C8Z7Y0_9GAMM|nr:flippase [Reinekea thalattae]TXR53348.1 flippase [Reinekea thalattae]
MLDFKNILSLFQSRTASAYINNTIWLLLEKLVRLFVAFIAEVIVARYLGVFDYGLWSYVMAINFALLALCTLGLDGILVREFVKQPSLTDKLLGSAFISRLIVSAIVMLILLLSMVFFQKDMLMLMIVIMSFSLLFHCFSVIDQLFQSRVQSKFVVFSSIISVSLGACLKLFLVFISAPVFCFALAYVSEIFILSLGYLYFNRRFGMPINNWSFSTPIAKSLLRDSWPLILSGVAISINMRVDQFMLKGFLGLEAVGMYASAVRILDLAVMLPHLISRSIFPYFVKLKEVDENTFYRRMSIAYKVFAVAMGSFAIILYFLAEYIVDLFYGAQYIDSVNVLRVGCIAIFLSSFAALNSVYLRVMNEQHKIMNRQWVNVILNLFLNVVLINRYGFLGAMYSTVISLFISTIVYDLFDSDLKVMNRVKFKIVGG